MSDVKTSRKVNTVVEEELTVDQKTSLTLTQGTIRKHVTDHIEGLQESLDAIFPSITSSRGKTVSRGQGTFWRNLFIGLGGEEDVTAIGVNLSDLKDTLRNFEFDVFDEDYQSVTYGVEEDKYGNFSIKRLIEDTSDIDSADDDDDMSIGSEFKLQPAWDDEG